MKICCNYNNYSTFSPSYKAITDINRTQPVQPQALQPQPLIPVEAKEESGVKYNWKTVAIVAGVSALALLGIAVRKPLRNLYKNLEREYASHEQYNNPNMKISVCNIKPENDVSAVNPNDIIESYEPERFFEISSKKRRKKPAADQIYLDPKGNVIDIKTTTGKKRKSAKHKTVTFDFGGAFQKPDSAQKPNRTYTAGNAIDDAADAALNFAIIDDIVNGGKEIKSGYEFVKNAFKSGAEPMADDVAAGLDDIAGHTSIFDKIADGISDVTDSIGDGLGDLTDSLSDLI